jgi:hypothetical protein
MASIPQDILDFGHLRLHLRHPQISTSTNRVPSIHINKDMPLLHPRPGMHSKPSKAVEEGMVDTSIKVLRRYLSNSSNIKITVKDLTIIGVSKGGRLELEGVGGPSVYYN